MEASKKCPPREVPVADHGASTVKVAATAALDVAISALRYQQRRAFLHALERLRPREISEAEMITPYNARVTLCHAKRKIAIRLGWTSQTAVQKAREIYQRSEPTTVPPERVAS